MLLTFVAFINVTYSYACRNIVNTIMTNGNSSLGKYTSHTLFEMVAKGLRERGELETEQNCNILTPSSSGYSSTYFSFTWVAQLGALRTASPVWAGSHAASYLQNSKLLNFLSHRVISLFDVHLLLVGVTSASNSTRLQSRLSPDIFDWMQLLFTQVHFLFNSSAGSEVTMLHKDF